jgi:uncharacterized protein YegP (UPF0339 family)
MINAMSRQRRSPRFQISEIIATSEAYESKASALNGIESVRTNAPIAEIDDQTEN